MDLVEKKDEKSKIIEVKVENEFFEKLLHSIQSKFKLAYLIYFVSLFLVSVLYLNYGTDEINEGIYTSTTTTTTNKPTNQSTDIEIRKPRIFCMVHTYPERFRSFLPASYHTWVRKCDNYKYISVIKLDDLPPAEREKIKQGRNEVTFLNKFQILQPNGWKEEDNEHLTEKNYYTFIEVYKKYPDYDWYLRADDDAFIFMENLERLLSNKDFEKATGFGYKFVPSHKLQKYWLSSGAGYVLSNGAMRVLSHKLGEDFDYCPKRGSQDQDIAFCLNRLNVSIEEQVDSHGLDRFHPFDLVSHLIGRLPQWAYFIIDNVFKIGEECCSAETISFNNLKADEMYKLSYYYSQYLMSQQNQKNMSFLYVLKNMEIYSRYGHVTNHEI